MIVSNKSFKIVIVINYKIEEKNYTHESYSLEDLKAFINWLQDEKGTCEKIEIR